MNWSSAAILLGLVAAAVVAAALAAYAWHHREVPAARSFGFLMLAVATMALAYALQLRSASAPESLFWGNVEYLGIVAIPTGWLAFALEYTGRGRFLDRRRVSLLAVAPLVTLALVWTNDAHHLVRRDVRLEPIGWLYVPAVTHGPWFWFHAAYAYLLLLAGTTLVVEFLLRGGYLARHQGGAALIAMLVPWVSNALYLAHATPFPYLDPTPVAFTVSGAIVAGDLFGFRLLDLVPVARDAVLAGMRDGVIVVDARGRIVEFSPAAEAIVGRPAHAVVGRAAAQALPGWPSGHVDSHATPLAGADGSTTHVELHLGEGPAQRTYDLRITPLRDWRGRVAGSVGVIRDITDRVRAEQERARLLQVQSAQAEELARRGAEAAALRQLDLLKTNLLGTVSHELRTPLTVVQGYAHRLRTRAHALDPAAIEAIGEHIQTASSQLRRLVEDLLDFDRLERGEIALQPQRFDVTSLLDEVLADFRRRPGGEHLVGTWPAALWVHADRLRVGQILAKLLENALAYAGGQPIVLQARLGTAEGSGEGGGSAAAVRVEVVDQGPGIAPEEQARIWERLYRGHGVAELNVARGMGIGLAVVKLLVEAQGGRVGLESTPGAGSCFWFELPAAPGAGPAS